MARKPSDVIASSSRPQGREVIWAAMRKLREFSLLDLEHETRIKLATIKTYIDGLFRAGFLEVGGETARDAKGRYLRGWWRLIKDTGVEAPRVTRAGDPVTQGRARQQMWVAMRRLKRFSYVDLAYAASTEEQPVSAVDAKYYCRFLARADYLRLLEAGGPARPAVYQFIRNTGPRAPQIQRVRQVFDPNLKQVTWAGGAA